MFKKGDRVEIKEPGLNYSRWTFSDAEQIVKAEEHVYLKGRPEPLYGIFIGEDVLPANKDNVALVATDNWGNRVIGLDGVGKVEQSPVEQPVEFEEGDKVRIHHKSVGVSLHFFKHWGIEVGSIGVVVSVDRDGVVGVMVDKTFGTFLPGDLEQVDEGPRECVEFAQLVDKKDNPYMMLCLLHAVDGKLHLGVSKCNRAAGDIYLKKEAKRISRRRAECARDTHGTAYFKDGSVMMEYDWSVDLNLLMRA